MANDDHIALLKKGVDAWNAWRKENPNIHPDFREADLSEANLVHADLSHANLFRAHLSDGADLKAGSYGQWFGVTPGAEPRRSGGEPQRCEPQRGVPH
jgi:hypothetical protein